jgi:hypothetical protein
MRGSSVGETVGRREAVRVALAVWVALIATCLAAGPASAGEYHVYSCRTPSGTTAPTSGWSGSIDGPWMYDPNSCASGGSLTAALDGVVEQPANAADAAWTFSAPAGTTIAAARLWLAGEARTSRVFGTTLYWLAAPDDSYASADVFARCENAEEGCTAKGDPQSPMSSENLVEVPSGNLSGATHIYMNASCGGGNGYSCPAIGGYAVWVSLYAADITLADDAPPVVSSVGGSLVAGGTLSGVQDISFSATDTGAGLYEAVFLVDGSVVSRQPLAPDDESCRNVGGTSNGSNAFFEVEPCPLALSDDLTFNTALASEGSHLLTVQVLDAAGNATTILNRQVTIDNKPAAPAPVAPAPVAPEPVNPVGGAPITITPSNPSAVSTSITVAPSTSSAVSGSASDESASGQVQLTARWVSTAREVRVSRYGAADRITGRLTNGAGQGISGAVIDVLKTPAYEGAKAVRLAGVRTGSTGQWALSLPRSVSSSALRFEYSGETAAAASATLRLSVHAGLELSIAPHTASVGKRIFFSGVVHGGPIPRGGKQLVLEARSGGGEWIQFDTVSTGARGRYHASYRFRLAGPITYQFRVVSHYESDFPFIYGTSNVVAVHEY